MKDNKGQALIEFILILPVVLLLLTSIFDVGNIIINKYQIQDNLDEIVKLYENDNSSKIENIISKEKINVTYEQKEDYTVFNVSKTLKLTTPGLDKILGNPYIISLKRNVYKVENKYNEEQ